MSDALCEVSGFIARYETPDSDGETRRERNARFSVETDDMPEIPEIALHLWQWFWQLNARRYTADSTVQPITYTEIDAWSRCTGTTITPSEVSVITAVDTAYRNALTTEIADQRKRAQQNSANYQP